MQQRQLRLGDILDDYCPRERRVTNHAVVAMLDADVKQTRCTTCDTEHEYKHAKVPRQRRKAETPAALYSQVLANAPKRVVHADAAAPGDGPEADVVDVEVVEVVDAIDSDNVIVADSVAELPGGEAPGSVVDDDQEGERDDQQEEGPVHRPLIRASLPRHEGQPPPTRPIPEFTIRQPAGRQNRFRPRHPRSGGGAGQPGNFFQGGSNRSGGNFVGQPRGPRQGGGPPNQSRRNNPGRRRPK